MNVPGDEQANDEDTLLGDPYSETGIPRWVRVFGIVALIVVVAFIVLMVAGGGDHGPRRHLRSGDDSTPTSGFTPHTTPPGGHAP